MLTEELEQAKVKISHLEAELSKAQLTIDWLKEQFKLYQQKQFGKSSESSELLQLPLFDYPETNIAEDEKTEQEEITYTRNKPKQKNGRNIDTSKLPRETRIHDLPEEQKACDCGCQLHKIGEDKSEQIDYIPAQLKVIEHIRIKYACRQCDTVKAGNKPEQAIPKSMATTGFIADIIIKKYQQHLPLYRQSKILSQQGIDIPDNTLGNWVMAGADVLMPLGDALWKQLNNVHVLQVDETRVKLLQTDKKAYFWAYHSCVADNRFIVFEFNHSRSGEVPSKRLTNFTSVLQTDGYSGYNELRDREGIINIGCWDHCRRKFAEVIKATDNKRTGKIHVLLSLINKLYTIERNAKGLSYEARQAERQKEAILILDMIEKRINQINAPPKSLLGKAVTYATNQWQYLTKYVKHGEAEISNCRVENQIRPFALGRRNWLFLGTEHSANKAAVLYSLIQTCIINKIEPYRYLRYVLEQGHAMRRGEVEPVNLLPQFIDNALLQN